MTFLRLRRLTVRRSPGIARSYAIEHLSEGLNLVVGPNAAGKTTTLRALLANLWPERFGAGFETESVWALGESEAWRFETREKERIGSQRDGIDAAPPPWPPEQEADRYTMSLHELLSETEATRALAGSMQKEIRGGYDLDAAGAAVAEDPGALRAESADFSKARERFKKIGAGDEELARQERELDSLRRRAVGLEEEKRAVAAARNGHDFASALKAFREAAREVDAHPEGVKRLKGGEGGMIDEAEAAIHEAGREIEATRAAAAEAERRRDETGFGGNGPEREAFERLAERIRRLESAEKRRDDAARLLREARERMLEAGKKLGPAKTTEHLTDAELEKALSEARDLLERDAGNRSAREALDALRRVLAVEDGDGDESRDRCERGADRLRRWLRTPPEDLRKGTEQTAWAAVAAGISLLALGLALVFLYHAAWILVSLPGALLIRFAWPLVKAKTAQPSVSRAALQAEFEELALDPPEAWTADGVKARLDDLERRSARLGEAAERRNAWRAREAERESAAREAEAIEVARRDLADRTGLDLARMRLADLPRLLSDVIALRRAKTELKLAEANQAALDDERKEALELLTRESALLGSGPVADAVEGGARMEEIRRRVSEWDAANRALASARQGMSLAVEKKHAAEEKRDGVLKELRLDPTDVAEARRLLAEWEGHKPDHDAARERLSEKRGVLANLRAAVATEDRQAFESLEEGALDERIASLRTGFERWPERERALDETKGSIREIETRLKDRRGRRDREAAWTEFDAARDRLGEALRRKFARLAVDRLVNGLKQATSDSSDVLRRAKEILLEVTRGKCELVFSSAGDFRVLEVETRAGRSLEELSSATRVHLLVAVRLAFVETMEGEGRARPPLLLDEVLANSDPLRAEGVGRAAMRAASGGRQVFAFTARPEEADFLERAAGEAGIAVKRIVLGEALAAAERAASPRSPSLPAPVPSPAGLSRDEYLERLEVPGVDLWAETADHLHLAHLVTDLLLLHRLLEQGFVRWGPLARLWESAASRPAVESVLPAAVHARAAGRARAIEAAAAAWRIGRGRRVDRAALEGSNAVSDRFIDQLAAIAAGSGGDARAILKAIAVKEVKSFRKADELEIHFRENGYLDPRASLSSDEILERAFAACAAAIEANAMTAEEVAAAVREVLPELASGQESVNPSDDGNR